MRFSTPEQVKEYAVRAATWDYQNHINFNLDLNPFCTDGARDDWQRGFNNAGPRSYESSVDYDTIYQRGRAAAEIVAKEKGDA